MILNNYFNKNKTHLNNELKLFIDKLSTNKITKEEFIWFLDNINYEVFTYLKDKAFLKRLEVYGNKVYIRGLIEISNYCQRDCYYCGIRKSNLNVERYRYLDNEILKIIDKAYLKGYRTIVLQGGEDNFYDDEYLVNLIIEIKDKYPDIALTLSLGEKAKDSYQSFKQAGANRYLLRHESASLKHYQKLHPDNMLLENRLDCLKNLKELNYQTGAGFMVGSPYQTNEDLACDLLLLQEMQPEMIGIGPYLNHHQTPFKDFDNGQLEHVLVCYALARLICPQALIPATTATSSLDKQGRKKALECGCNVIMINLSDFEKRQNYSLYENKSYVGDESQEYVDLIKKDIESVGLEMDYNIGNHIGV